MSIDGKIVKINGEWMVHTYFPLHSVSRSEIENLDKRFDNIEARIAEDPNVEFTIVESQAVLLNDKSPAQSSESSIIFDSPEDEKIFFEALDKADAPNEQLKQSAKKMKVTFADSFFVSLDRLQRHQTWWYKLYEFFRYNLPAFFRNLWIFRKELYRYRAYDYSFSLRLLRRGLEQLVDNVRDGMEINDTRLPKVDQMERVIFLIKQLEDDTYIDRMEKELGPLSPFTFDDTESEEEKEHNRKVFAAVRELENSEWEEIWTIINKDMRGWWT